MDSAIEIEADNLAVKNATTLNDINELREAVLSKRPVLKNILKKHGTRSVFRYLNEYITKPLAPVVSKKKQEEFLAAFRAEVEPRLGPEIAERGVRQLRKYYYVSTTDHFGPMYHPWVFNFNLLSAAACRDSEDQDLAAIITLACSNVSLNNFSFPRGLIYTTPGTDGKAVHNRLSFLPSNAHSFPVYNFRPYSITDIEKIKKIIPQQLDGLPSAAQIREELFRILDEIYSAPEVLVAKNYADQISLTNGRLWKELQCKCTDHKYIDFIYIEQERVVNRLLIEHHLNAQSPIGSRLFNEEAAGRFQEMFDGLPEAFNRAAGTGTYLFWYNPPNNKHRVPLLYSNGQLLTADGSVNIPLTPEAIREGLITGSLIPSVLMTFLLLFCYYGVTCLGGMGQTGYLPKIQKKWCELMTQEGKTDEAETCEKLFGSFLGGEMTVAYIDGLDGIFAPATSLDLILYGDDDARACIIGQAKGITMNEAIDPLLPDDYPMHFKSWERDPRLAAITGEDIAKVTGLSEAISPCLHLNCGGYHTENKMIKK